jgi:hypothetical protein
MVGTQITPVSPTLGHDNPPAMNSAARVHCSFTDWAKFLQMHLDGHNGVQGLLVSTSVFTKLHTAYPGQTYTYGGWILTQRDWAGGPVLTHEGSNTLNLAAVWIAPAKNRILMTATNIATDDARTAYNEALSYVIHLP